MRKQGLILLVSAIVIISVTFLLVYKSYEKDDTLAYIDLESLENERNSILETIYRVDNILLSKYNKENGIDSSFMLETVIGYILNNYDAYKDEIVYLENEFVYEEDETEYITNEFIDISLLQKESYKLFNKEIEDLTEHEYYDINTGYVALISKGQDVFIFEERKVEFFKEISKDVYEIKIIYLMDSTLSIEKEVKYILTQKNGSCYIQDIDI